MNEYQRFFQLGNAEQALKPKCAGRDMMVTEFIYMCHGKMFDSDTGKPFHIILKYSNNYDGYCTVEDVVIQIRDTHTTCIKLHPGCTFLYIIDYS